MSGHIQKRGKNSWRLKFEGEPDPLTRKRKIYYETFRGTKQAANLKLAELIVAVGNRTYTEPVKITVAEFVKERIYTWETRGDISSRTAIRYRELLTNQVAPHLGNKILQRLKPIDIENWHTSLLTKISARTIGHAHRVLSKALNDAAKNDMVPRNVAKVHSAPKPDDKEAIIAHDVPALLEKLKGSRLEMMAIVALFTGMRLSEVLALKWPRVDLDKKTIQVREALDENGGFKAPKSKAGNRDITLPDILVNALRDHRKAQLEFRMRSGAGKLADDALLFSDIDGRPLSRNAISAAWGDFAASIKLPDLTFHALRHTHASQLIDAGVDIVTISKRLGHAKPDITLRVYSHLFRKSDDKAAAAINSIFG
jgi:integrase